MAAQCNGWTDNTSRTEEMSRVDSCPRTSFSSWNPAPFQEPRGKEEWIPPVMNQAGADKWTLLPSTSWGVSGQTKSLSTPAGASTSRVSRCCPGNLIQAHEQPGRSQCWGPGWDVTTAAGVTSGSQCPHAEFWSCSWGGSGHLPFSEYP